MPLFLYRTARRLLCFFSWFNHNGVTWRNPSITSRSNEEYRLQRQAAVALICAALFCPAGALTGFEISWAADSSGPLSEEALEPSEGKGTDAPAAGTGSRAPLQGRVTEIMTTPGGRSQPPPAQPVLKKLQGRFDKAPAPEDGIDLADLVGQIENRHFLRPPTKSATTIDPQAQLAVRDNNRHVPLLEVNDRGLIPLIVSQCFSEMNCLETFEIGSNSLTAATDWMPLQVSGRTAAFGLDGQAHPAFKASVNGRPYTFDVILPDLTPGRLRKVLLITNREKICAVDVESFETWLLRLQAAPDGTITSARWYKLTHVKPRPGTPTNIPPTIAKPRHPNSIRNW